MIVYAAMFVAPLAGGLLSAIRANVLTRVLWGLVGVFLTLVIGTRRYVGADWANYDLQFYANAVQSLFEAWQDTDIAYATVSWFLFKAGLDIYGLNLVCAAILVAGVMALAARQPDRWVALLVAVPYTLLVVGMGYTRQSAALGLECFALLALMDRRLARFGVFAILAVLFHKSAIVLLPLILFANTGRPILSAVVLIAAALLGTALATYSANFDVLRSTYLDQRLSSDGTLARLLVASVSAVGFLIIASKAPITLIGKRVFVALSLCTLALLSLAWTSSTAIDRLALYLLPVQIVFWGSLSAAFKQRQVQIFVNAACIAAHGALMYIWLTGSDHAYFWLPYRTFVGF